MLTPKANHQIFRFRNTSRETVMSSYEEQTVMVIGYNARPIVRLAKQLGLKVTAIDYWGDVDIIPYADTLLTVLRPTPHTRLEHPSHKPLSELLYDLAEKAFHQRNDIDFILLGSGLDDRPDLWSRLNRLAPVLGCPPETLKTVRNPEKLFSVAGKVGVSYPKTERAKEAEECVEVAEKFGFPVLLKPLSSSGGFRLRLARNPAEAKKHFKTVSGRHGEIFVQEHIEGIDASSSIIGNGKDCVVVSVNEQLIGIKRLGANTPFGYCGNIVPLKANEKTVNRIKDVSYALGKRLNLIGSNGFDFVIGKKDEFYLMEVNPRFQATLECIQYVTGLNLVSEHIRACHGELPEKIPKPKGYAVKMIVFAKHLSKIPDLSKLKNVFDITNPSTIVDKGEPICTVQIHESTREKAIRKAWKSVQTIYQLTSKNHVRR
jgi:hypothetical protein